MLIELALALDAQAATLPVCPTCAYTTLSAAITAAASGDTIQIESGSYPVNGLSIAKGLTIAGRGPGVTTLTVPSTTNGVAVQTNLPVTIRDLTLDGANVGKVGISGANGSFALTLTNLEVTRFTDTANAAIDLNGTGAAQFTATGLDVHDNRGRALYAKGVMKPPTTGQPAPAYATVTDSSFTANGTGASNDGGGVYVENSALRFVRCTFTANRGARGGGLGVRMDPAAVLVEDSWFEGNTAAVGAALDLVGGGGQHAYGEVARSTFVGNNSTQTTGAGGGAIELSGAQTAVIYDSTFRNNQAVNGGALYVGGSSTRVSVRRSTFCANTATNWGGAALLESVGTIASNYVFANNRYVENHANTSGGAINSFNGAYDEHNALYVGNTSPDGALRWSGTSGGAVVRDAIVGQNSTYGLSASAPGTLRYSDWYANTPANTTGYTLDASNLTTTPTFFAYTADGNCDNDDFRIAQSSPLVNAGDPSLTDLDGSRSDVGPWGGPDAGAAWWADGDKDGVRWVYDCDDANAAVVGAQTWLYDADKDGYGTTSKATSACIAPSGYVPSSKVDCDDTKAAVSPAATETCNGLDDDCDGSIDENVLTRYYRDADADTYGDATVTQDACKQPSGYAANSTDCNDGDAIVHPNAAETCDGLDRNCDGDPVKNATDAKAYYKDSDGDGYAPSATSPVTSCSAPAGYAPNTGDCDDANDLRFPGATEQCNLVDDDCDGSVDEGVVNVNWYVDGDGDGYGDQSGTALSDCKAPAGRVANNADCLDGNASVRPGATEVCNNLDDNCDGTVDTNAADAKVWYRDADNDGYGVSTTTSTACTEPIGFVPSAGDCDDADGNTWPSAPEDCAAADRDCDGQPANDPTDAQTFWPDADGDGYGDASGATTACARPGGTVVPTVSDCDDASDVVNPGAPEQCGDAIDADCDGAGGPGDDDDGDGILNEIEFAFGSDGCVSDSDGDGIADAIEWGGPVSAPPVNHDGDSLADVADADDDDDAIPTATEGTDDFDGDSLGNWLDDDSDDDGFLDVEEGAGDSDADGKPDYLDPADTGTDSDGDGLSDLFESDHSLDPFLADSDGDGLRDGLEADETKGTWDTDEDGTIDALDDDDDGDGVSTADEDLDGDGDWTNDDSDGDGVAAWLDADEPVADTGGDTAATDSDGDGIPDEVEGDEDLDGDGIPNAQDDDSDGDGAADAAEGTGDYDGDGIPDYLDAGSVDREGPPAPPALCGCATSGTGGFAPLAALAGALLARRRRRT